MATPRKLNQEQERQATLAYLCGVNVEYIADKWKISDETLRRSIVGKRSHEWQDSLVEFYRQTLSTDRARNAIHLYLHGEPEGQDFPNRNLIGYSSNQAYEEVRDSIFESRTKKLIKETKLEEILATPIKLTPEERLLRAIFGYSVYWQAVSIVEPRLYTKLREAYFSPQRVNLDSIYDEVKSEIYALLHIGLLHVKNNEDATEQNSGLAEAVEQSLQTLSPREAEILRKIFGIGVEPYSTQQLRQEKGIGRSRLYQIRDKGLRKMRHPSRSKILRPFIP